MRYVRGFGRAAFGPATVALVAAACAGTPRPLTPPVPEPAATEIDVSVYLLGDAGKPDSTGEPVFEAVAEEIKDAGSRSIVVFLGDNIYPRGLPDSLEPDRAVAERYLDAQIELVLTTGARGIFVPGNHDWGGHSIDGWESIRRQGRYIARRGAPQVRLLPTDGCPGPVVEDVGDQLRFVILDTQWWLHTGPRPAHPTSTCSTDSDNEVTAALQRALVGAGERITVVLAHHPLTSGGPHGGYFVLKDHLFPLRVVSSALWIPVPILGSAYPLARQWGYLPQDISSEQYKRMRRALEKVLEANVPLLYAAGHEHTLEVHEGLGPKYMVVSGVGYYGHTSPVRWLDSTIFAQSASGFARLDILRDGRVRLGVITVDETGGGTEAFSMWLK